MGITQAFLDQLDARAGGLYEANGVSDWSPRPGNNKLPSYAGGRLGVLAGTGLRLVPRLQCKGGALAVFVCSV